MIASKFQNSLKQGLESLLDCYIIKSQISLSNKSLNEVLYMR